MHTYTFSIDLPSCAQILLKPITFSLNAHIIYGWPQLTYNFWPSDQEPSKSTKSKNLLENAISAFTIIFDFPLFSTETLLPRFPTFPLTLMRSIKNFSCMNHKWQHLGKMSLNSSREWTTLDTILTNRGQAAERQAIFSSLYTKHKYGPYFKKISKPSTKTTHH